MENLLLEKNQSNKTLKPPKLQKTPPKPSVSTEIKIAPLALVLKCNCCYKWSQMGNILVTNFEYLLLKFSLRRQSLCWWSFGGGVFFFLGCLAFLSP